MSPVVVMFNGPPRAGKDTAANVFKAIFGGDMMHFKFTTVVKDKTHERFDVAKYYGLQSVPTDFFENEKDDVIDALGGKTPRAAYIETSRLLKEQHNDNIIADLTLESTFGSRQPVLVNSDLGFNCEGRVFQDYYGAANCLIVKVSRPGFEFNDNRAYVDLPDVETVHVNNIDPDQYKKDLIKISERHLQPKIQCAPSFR